MSPHRRRWVAVFAVFGAVLLGWVTGTEVVWWWLTR